MLEAAPVCGICCMDKGWQQGLLPFFPEWVVTGQSLHSVVCVWVAIFFFFQFNFLSPDLNSRVLLVVSVCIGQLTLLSKLSCISVLL